MKTAFPLGANCRTNAVQVHQGQGCFYGGATVVEFLLCLCSDRGLLSQLGEIQFLRWAFNLPS